MSDCHQIKLYIGMHHMYLYIVGNTLFVLLIMKSLKRLKLKVMLYFIWLMISVLY